MTSLQHVTDVSSNLNDQLVYIAEVVIGRSRQRRKVFEAIYFGKKKHKKVSEIAKITKMTRKRVLEEGRRLYTGGAVGQTKADRETAYTKDVRYAHHKAKILSLNMNRKKLKALPTKTNPKVTVRIQNVAVPKRLVRIRHITIDDLDQFKKIKDIKRASAAAIPMAEAKFKKGIQRIIGEAGSFQDWGGERNDLHTTRVRLNGKRVSTAIAFKGKGKKGILTPKMMGKNADQIPRLFNSAAKVFLLQYWDQISEAVYDQMEAYATIRSISDGDIVYYGVIDGVDSARVVRAYPKAFK